MTTRYWNGSQWDTLRPFNIGLVRDLELLFEWDVAHPNMPAFYPDLIAEANKSNRYGENIQESREIAKLLIWKMVEWCGHLYPDARETCHYRINEYGKSVYRGEVAFPYEYWQSDKTLNYAYSVFIHQVRNRFDVRPLRKLYLRREGNPPEPDDPTPPSTPDPTPPSTPPKPKPMTIAQARKKLERERLDRLNEWARS